MSDELPNSISETGYELYPKNGEEVWNSFLHFSSLGKTTYDYNLIEDSLKETANIAFDKIEDFLPDTKVRLPSWVVPAGKRPEQVLARLCADEMKKRGLAKNQTYIERLKNELYVIKDRKFCEYFLTMKMIIDEARTMMMVGPGRGSSAGSLVAYLLDITQVDPIKWNLQFERFLSRSGTGFPDIDTDFSNSLALKEHFKEKWGENSVVQITNFSTLQVKSLIKDICKFHHISFEEINDVVLAMTKETMSLAKEEHDITAGVYVPTYEEYKKYSTTLQAFLAKYPQVDAHIENLHGQIRQCSTHASGVLIADNLNEHMPLINVGGKTQTPWAEGQAQRLLEPMGFIKFDILGLSTLAMFESCIKQVLQRRFNNPSPTFDDIREFYNKNLHPDIIDFNNQEIWENIFQQGKWVGIFQFTNSGAQKFCQQVKPTSLTELSDITSTYRPGPMQANVPEKYLAVKNGEEFPEYVHPIVKEILEPTQGQMIYQESVAMLAHRLGNNLSLDDGNTLRKLLTKKGTGKNDLLDGLYEKFRQGCIDKGISPEKTDELLQHIEFFNKYGFSINHATCYSIISYQCAYLMHHYGPEFCCAFLEKEPEEKKEKSLSIVKSLGYKIEPTNINTSGKEWKVSDQDEMTLIQPLTSIKGLGPAAADEIMKFRPFKTIEELLFHEEISYMRVNKAKLDVLARAGALKDLIDSRFNHLKQFWLSCINERPKNVKQLRENIEASKLEPDFTRTEKIEFLTDITGIYPIDLVLTEIITDKLKYVKMPPISEFIKELGVAWCIPKKLEIRRTKNDKPYFVVEVIDSNFVLTLVRCWGIYPGKDRLFLNHPYLVRPLHNERWGFSTSGPIAKCWKLLGT
jgi:DNA polymerase-3 subunit alpha